MDATEAKNNSQPPTSGNRTHLHGGASIPVVLRCVRPLGQPRQVSTNVLTLLDCISCQCQIRVSYCGWEGCIRNAKGDIAVLMCDHCLAHPKYETGAESSDEDNNDP